MLAWASLEALGCPENGSGNLCRWTRSCGPHSDDSFPGLVAGERTGQRHMSECILTYPQLLSSCKGRSSPVRQI